MPPAQGTEIKSCRHGKMNLRDGYCQARRRALPASAREAHAVESAHEW